jgi:EAL domain-containing protein (putative c-di-GMP-specific phosphodiesterase class I)
MYRAKSNGKGRHEVFFPEGADRETGDGHLRDDLQRAFDQGEFQLFYQPVVDLKSGETISVEALLRWRHPQRGLLLPGEFLALAEESQLMAAIGEWVLRTACAQVKVWHEAGYRDLRVAVNTSTGQLHGQGFMKLVPEVLAEIDLEPRYLEIEVSERTALQQLDSTAQTLAGLIHLGVSLVIDDFGKEGSALGDMERFPGAALKLDPEFILGDSGNPERAATASAAIARAHTLDRKVVAKRVETSEQLAQVIDQGCDLVQGYMISQAIPAGCVGDFLQHNRGSGFGQAESVQHLLPVAQASGDPDFREG